MIIVHAKLRSDPLAKNANFLKLICRNPRFLLRVVLMLVTKLELDSGTPTKKGNTLCNYRAEWSAEFDWCLKVDLSGKVFAANCNLCSKTYELGTVSQRLSSTFKDS
jgi:hypothetical protein